MPHRCGQALPELRLVRTICLAPQLWLALPPLCRVCRCSLQASGARGSSAARDDEFSALMVFSEQGLERRLLWLAQRAAHLRVSAGLVEGRFPSRWAIGRSDLVRLWALLGSAPSDGELWSLL